MLLTILCAGMLHTPTHHEQALPGITVLEINANVHCESPSRHFFLHLWK